MMFVIHPDVVYTSSDFLQYFSTFVYRGFFWGSFGVLIGVIIWLRAYCAAPNDAIFVCDY